MGRGQQGSLGTVGGEWGIVWGPQWMESEPAMGWGSEPAHVSYFGNRAEMSKKNRFEFLDSFRLVYGPRERNGGKNAPFFDRQKKPFLENVIDGKGLGGSQGTSLRIEESGVGPTSAPGIPLFFCSHRTMGLVRPQVVFFKVHSIPWGRGQREEGSRVFEVFVSSGRRTRMWGPCT